MRSFLAVLALGLIALIAQGVLARALPPPWCPDLAWLLVIALGLRWPSFVSGLLVAALLGYAQDLLSGSLMGQHALLGLLSHLTAALAARQLDLSGALPVAFLVFVTRLLHGLAMVGTLSLFVDAPGVDLHVLGQAVAHALVNVVAAWPVLAGVERLRMRLLEEELGHRGWPMGLPLGRHV